MLALVLLALALVGCRQGRRGAELVTTAAAPAAEFVWSGALTPTSIVVVGGLRGAADGARLVVRTEEGAAPTVQTAPIPVPLEGRVVRLAVTGLRPGTRYRYAFELADGPLGPRAEGTFRTPSEGPFSFGFAVGACAQTGSTRRVFDAIRARDPLFFLHLGDFHYENVAVAEPRAFRRAIGRVLRSPAQSRLYRSAPIAYVWDDHDFGPNDSHRLSPGRTAARLVYQELVPHYPLAAGAGDVPIAQAFTIGRVRFLLTDLRSERDPPGAGPTMLGARQKAWLMRELLLARDRYPVTIWTSTVPWIAPAAEGADHWGGYAEERREIAAFLRDHGIRNVVLLAGDAHMIAMDDGTNSNYSGEPGLGFPVVHVAALDRPGSVKGGPYSEGTFPSDFVPPHDGQWVWVEVADDGGPEVCLTWTGYRTGWASGRTQRLVEMARCFEAPLEG